MLGGAFLGLPYSPAQQDRLNTPLPFGHYYTFGELLVVRFLFDDPFETSGPLARKESLSSSHPRLHVPSDGVPKPKPM